MSNRTGLSFLLLIVFACGRTELDIDHDAEQIERSSAAGAPSAPGLEPEPDAGVGQAGADAGAPLVPPVSVTPSGPVSCVPTAETCNGEDDDCNGQVDEDLPPTPCPAGGYRYCVAGRYSECPRRCEVCVPGSERVCFVSYCTFWGAQRCTADGSGFGSCREDDPPPECNDIAQQDRNSPELEQCCLDHGYCCWDRHDLDGDGITNESLGECGEVLCAG